MPKARLGVALLLPPDVACEVDGLRRGLGDPALGRIAPHVTLVPPVNVREDRLDGAYRVLRDAAAATRPFGLRLGPPATFLPDNPVLYLAVGGDVPALAALRDRVFAEPLARTLTWPWVPHVTVADEAPPDVIAAAVRALAGYSVDVVFDRVHLLREGPGRMWEPVSDAPFAPTAVLGRGGLPLELVVTRQPEGEVPFTVTARRDGREVGAATGTVRGLEARLDRLAVVPDERRRGVGSALAAAVESLAAGSGAVVVTCALPADEGARAFLAARGWVDAGGELRRHLGAEPGQPGGRVSRSRPR